MRYRKPKNLDEKLKPYADLFLSFEEKVLFNKRPLYLEMGMGRGDFITSIAEAFPQRQYIGIEKQNSLLLAASEKIEKKKLSNVRLLHADAKRVLDYLGEESVSTIYLNFSDPWKKQRHESRRLSHISMLQLYEKILINEGKLRLKTDNEDFFRFTLKEMENSNFSVIRVIEDLYHEDRIKNIDSSDEVLFQTEYEKKFVKEGKPIFCVDCIILKS